MRRHRHGDKACFSNVPKSTTHSRAGRIPGRLGSPPFKYCIILSSLEAFILSRVMKTIRWLHWAQWPQVKQLFASTFETDDTIFQNILTAVPQTRNVPFSPKLLGCHLYVTPVRSCHSSVIRWGSSWPVYLGVGGNIVKITEMLGNKQYCGMCQRMNLVGVCLWKNGTAFKQTKSGRIWWKWFVSI